MSGEFGQVVAALPTTGQAVLVVAGFAGTFLWNSLAVGLLTGRKSRKAAPRGRSGVRVKTATAVRQRGERW